MKYSSEEWSKHLEFIQNAITRMSNNSFILKGWAVTIVSLLFALAMNNSDKRFVILAILPTLVFWGLDAYYLRREKLFRELYDYVRLSERKNLDAFSMSTKKFENKVDMWCGILFSSTVISLYGMITLLIIVMFAFVR